MGFTRPCCPVSSKERPGTCHPRVAASDPGRAGKQAWGPGRKSQSEQGVALGDIQEQERSQGPKKYRKNTCDPDSFASCFSQRLAKL